MNKDQVRMPQGVEGHETERELLFYVINKLDEFNERNTEQHNTITQNIGLCNKDISNNKTTIKYIKLGVYGLFSAVLFILSTIFLI
jgi:hypothetical protein